MQSRRSKQERLDSLCGVTFVSQSGAEFIDENGGGPGVRLRRAPKGKSLK